MVTYQSAVSKPERTLINYTTVRAAELKEIYNSLISDRTVQNIFSDFAHDKDDNVRNCINFLHGVDLIERDGDDRVISPLNNELFPNMSFEPRLLYHVRQQPYPSNHLTRIQNIALETADRSVTLDVLLPKIKDSLSEYDFKWNKKKLEMWRTFSTQLGLVSQTKTRDVILSPCRRLLYELFEHHTRQEDTKDLYNTLSWIEENFFNVFDTTTGTPRVHPAISDVLQNMEAENVLKFRGLSDAKSEVTLPESVHTQNSRSVAEYELHPMPDSPKYQYPLTQFNQVITQ